MTPNSNISETYVWRAAQNRPEGELWVITRSRSPLRKLRGATWHPELAPSWDLLNDYKDGLIDWSQYTMRFRKEMLGNPSSVDSLKRLANSDTPIVLVCFESKPPCHRFLVIELVSDLQLNLI